MKNSEQLKHLHGWVIVYNAYIGKYKATTRDNYFDLFNGESTNVVSSDDINTLHEIIIINKGSLENVINWKKQFK